MANRSKASPAESPSMLPGTDRTAISSQLGKNDLSTASSLMLLRTRRARSCIVGDIYMKLMAQDGGPLQNWGFIRISQSTHHPQPHHYANGFRYKTAEDPWCRLRGLRGMEKETQAAEGCRASTSRPAHIEQSLASS